MTIRCCLTAVAVLLAASRLTLAQELGIPRPATAADFATRVGPSTVGMLPPVPPPPMTAKLGAPLAPPTGATMLPAPQSLTVKDGAAPSPPLTDAKATLGSPANDANLARAWSDASCGHNHRCWLDAEYLLWWTRSADVPPLVGALPGSLARVPETAAEIIQLRGPDSIVSPATVGFGATSGLRLSGGLWLDPQSTIGLDAGYFGLEHRAVALAYSSNGNPVLGPAYFAPILEAPVLIENAVPGIRSGAVALGLTQQLWGVETNVRLRCLTFLADRADFLIGFRHLQLNEGLTVAGTSALLPPSLTAGNTNTTFDSFGTHNQFYGPQIGMTADYRWGPWSLDWQAKLALGCMSEVANIQGATVFVNAGIPTTVPGGVFALPTNSGHHSREVVAVIPEFTLKAGYHVTPALRLFVGYNVLYLNNVLRPGQQIDTNVNTFQVPSLASFNPATPANSPAFRYSGGSFWAQGINFGVEVQY